MLKRPQKVTSPSANLLHTERWRWGHKSSPLAPSFPWWQFPPCGWCKPNFASGDEEACHTAASTSACVTLPLQSSNINSKSILNEGWEKQVLKGGGGVDRKCLKAHLRDKNLFFICLQAAVVVYVRKRGIINRTLFFYTRLQMQLVTCLKTPKVFPQHNPFFLFF